MKTKLTILLIALTSSAHANLIDLTPGGFSLLNIPPNIVPQFIYMSTHQLAGANINGNTVTWSPFEPFGPAQFTITPLGTDAIVSWNLANTGGFMFQYLFLGSNNYQANLYRVPFPELINGTAYVTIDGLSNIDEIIFSGTNILPERLNCFVAFAIAVVGLLLTYKLQRRRTA
jgi:hypothetical protein